MKRAKFNSENHYVHSQLLLDSNVDKIERHAETFKFGPEIKDSRGQETYQEQLRNKFDGLALWDKMINKNKTHCRWDLFEDALLKFLSDRFKFQPYRVSKLNW